MEMKGLAPTALTLCYLWCFQLQRVPIPKVEEEKDLITLFSEYPWGDLWADADLIPVIRYVYGARRLKMPDCWKAVFPISLPDMDCESD